MKSISRAIGLFSCVLLASSLFASVHAAHADIASNLLLYYPMENNQASTVVTDSSGNSRTGNLSTNTSNISTAGKINLGFGMQASDSLDTHYAWAAADSNFTISTWFKTTQTSQTLFSSYNGQRGLIGLILDNSGRPECQVISSNNHFNYTIYNHSYSDGAWHQIACVMSGTTLTMYMDGAAMNTVTDSLWNGDYRGPSPRTMLIGGMTGTLDEARMYNRALSASDVSELYAFSGAPTAPQVSSVFSTTTATTATVTWTTSQSASSTVNFGLSSSYGYASTSDAMSTSHSIQLVGLTPSTTYHYRVSSGNSFGLVGTSSDYTFTTRSTDTTPPAISAVASTTSFTAATISWTTNEISDSKVWYGTASGTYTASSSSASLTVSHSLALTGLSASTKYYYVVVSADASGNIATSSEYALLTGTPDTAAPAISSVSALTAATTATISWNTDEAASSTVNFGLSPSYGSASSSAALVTSHSVKLAGLMASTTYHFQVRSADAAGNVSTSNDYTFTTDTTPGVTLCGGTCLTLHDGDVFEIVSDSITTVDMFNAYLESYFHLRYPTIHIHFRMIARSGGDLNDFMTNGRYEMQGNPLSPNVVAILMSNNGGYTADQYISQVTNFVDNYAIGMSSSTPLIFSPAPFNNASGGSDLSQYTDKINAFASTYGHTYADIWNYLHPIWAANLASSSPVDIQDGGDDVHMGPPAHLSIAYAMLAKLNADPNVSSANIDASSGTLTSSSRAAISNLTKTSDGVSFTRLDQALPMGYDERSLPMFKIMPQIYDLNKYMLTVTNLDPGYYEVYVDGRPSATVSSSELAAGWNMAKMTHGPIFEQLEEVVGRTRDKEGQDRIDQSPLSPLSGMQGYLSNAGGCYVTQGFRGDALKTCLATPIQNLNSFDNLIYAAAQPVARSFSLHKITGSPDTTAPVISDSTPASLPQGTATTTLSISTDENAVCRYSTRAQVPYSLMTNTFSVTGGTTHTQAISSLLDGVTYTYYVRCADTLENNTLSDHAVSFSVNAEPNPVAYYKFDEGTGSTTADSSGNGHTAILINSPAWVSGKIGPGALSFNGTDNVVNAGNIADADGVGALSVSAWVKAPGNFISSGGYNVVTKYASGQGPWVLGYSGPSRLYFCTLVNSAGASATAAGSIVPLADSSWHLVTCVYNGTNVTVYTDGIAGGAAGSINSPAFTGIVKDTNYPVCIGSVSNGSTGCLTSSALWSGLIDDVRIYKRALSPAEIAALASPDLTSPMISSIAATTTPVSASVSWTTDESSDSMISFGTASGTYTMSTSSASLGTSHSLDLTGLSASTTYYYVVASTDASGNTATSSERTFTTAAAPDTTAPVISSVATSTTYSSAIITWTTDEVASSLINFGLDANYGTASSSNGLATSHLITLAGLNPSTVYHFQVVSADAAGNGGTSTDLVFVTPAAPDTVAPVISGITASTTDSDATVSWTTDESSDSAISYGTASGSYEVSTSSDQLGTSHSFDLVGLSASTTYYYIVASKDASGNAATSSERTLVTSAAPDVTPPVISSIEATSTDSTATIIWNTDEAASSVVNFGITSDYGSTTVADGLVTAHSVALTGLIPASPYHYQVVSTDAAGNISTSSDLTFVTTATPDTTAPVISAANASTTDSSAAVSWSTDEAADSVIFYGMTSGTYLASSSVAALTVSHSIDLNELSASTTYYYVISSTDAAGNTATSSEQTFITSATPDTSAPVISSVNATSTDTAAIITWTTDENASSSVNFGLDANYGTASTSDSFEIAHSITLIGLNPSTTYHYQVVSTDSVGNVSTSSDLTFVTAATPDTTAPVISSVTASTTDTSAVINWTTDESSDSTAFYGTVPGTYTGSSTSASLVTSHSIDLTALSASTTYYYVVSSTDGAGNTATSSEQAFTTSTAPDTAAPVISSINASTTDSTATITWNTDEAASSVINFGTTSDYGSTTVADGLVTEHTVELIGLISSGAYHYQVVSTDSAGNVSTSSDLIFETAATPDITAPVISSISASTTDSAAVINWNTDETSDSTVSYGTASGIYTASTSVASLTNSHAISLNGLVASTTYYFLVVSTDAVGNTATSSEGTFVTSATPDTDGPVISSVISTSTPATATITWTTDENASALVNYGIDSGYGSASTSNAFETDHVIVLAGLDPETTYHFQVVSVDQSGNVSTSSDLVFTTPAIPDQTAPVISSVSASTTDTSATIVWNTDEVSDSVVSFGTASGIYTASTSIASLTTSHSVNVSELIASTTYYYVISSTDAAGNTATSSEETLTTSAAPDLTAPLITSVDATSTDTSAVITWTTDENASTAVNYGQDETYGNATTSNEFVTVHSVTLENLSPSTTYHFQAVSTDQAGNAASSTDLTFTTAATPDTTAPVISSVTATSTDTGAIIAWNTDESSDSTVMYGTVSGDYVASTSASSLATVHSLDLTGLSASTTYFFVVSSTDESGNTATSSEQSFVTSAMPDVIAPLISSIASSTEVTTATVTWNTNEAASSMIEYGTDESYGSATSSDSSETEHSFSLTGLNANTLYHFRVLSIDAAGNTATSTDLTFTTLVAPDTAAPIISSVSASTTDSIAQITWNSDELSDSIVFFGTASGIYTASSSMASLTASHTIALNELLASTTYYFIVASTDASGNTATSSELSFVTSSIPDTTAPVISAIASSTEVTTATISWTTNENANSTINYGLTADYGLATTTDIFETGHTIVLADLNPSTAYHYQVVSTDSSGNVSTSSDLVFETAAAPDATAPMISGIAASTTDSSATITWNTDELSDSTVVYGTVSGNYTASTTAASLVASHQIQLNDLAASTTYYYEVVSTDASGNTASSSEQSFTTSAAPDVTAPVVSSVNATSTDGTATITWATDEPAASIVNYGLDSSYGFATSSDEFVTDHSVMLTGLAASTTYHFSIVSTDQSGNVSTSSDFMFTTAIAQDLAAPVISSIASTTGETIATITWITDEAATSTIEYGIDDSYGFSTTSDELATSHSFTLAGLASGSVYHFRAISTDASGNLATSSDMTFETVQTAIAPQFIASVATSTTANTATIRWMTLGTTTAMHSMILSGLSPSTTYQFKVTFTDDAGAAATTTDMTFTTIGE